VAIALLSLAACGESSPETTDQTTAGPQQAGTTAVQPTDIGSSGTTFSLEELARFDGKDGSPAYVAADGVVYDVSESRSWPEGDHIRCNLGAMAGRDLSEELAQAPVSMRDLLADMPVVGRLAQ
jgi:predicted heme/steroid binding protein